MGKARIQVTCMYKKNLVSVWERKRACGLICGKCRALLRGRKVGRGKVEERKRMERGYVPYSFMRDRTHSYVT